MVVPERVVPAAHAPPAPRPPPLKPVTPEPIVAQPMGTVYAAPPPPRVSPKPTFPQVTPGLFPHTARTRKFMYKQRKKIKQYF